MTGIIKKIPIPMAGLMLALASLGNLLSSYNVLYKNIIGTISAILLLLMIIKLISMPKEWLKDIDNPVVASIAPTFFMGLMILSTYIKPFSNQLGFSVWIIAVLLHAAYIFYFTKKYILNFNIKKVFASYFVVYVGIVAASLSAPAFNMESLGQGIFWFGFVSYLVLLPIIIYRLMKYSEMPEPAIPTTTILTAPANLCLAGYLSSFQNKNLLIISFLGILSLIMFICVIAYLPKMLKIKFYPSYSSFTFPFVITAVAMKTTNAFFIKMGKVIFILPYYVKLMELLAAIIVLYVLTRYIGFLFINNQGVKVQKSA